MAAKFSSLMLTVGFNDYLAPSQGCEKSSAEKSKSGRLEAREPVEGDIVKISPKDCLACSSCITSVETVLLQKHSLNEFLSNIHNGKAVIFSLSPQSRASLATHFKLSPLQVHRKLTTFLKRLGVKAIFDTSCSRDLSLIESCHEFVTRYKNNKAYKDGRQNLLLPMISSACPGWIAYAEKNRVSYVLPYISSVKSPQQIAGAAIKNHLCKSLFLMPEDIYHVTVMPCYDKKLEAVREDFVFQVKQGGEMLAEVDLVLTTEEILDLIESKEVDFTTLEESSLDRLLTNIDEGGHLFGVQGSSGGYAEAIFRYAAKVLFDKDIVGPLDFKPNSKDFKELSLEVDGQTVLRFALCYGFSNVENVVKKIKQGTSEFQFLEIMACPSGCLNGGGQIKPDGVVSAVVLSRLLQVLETKYMEDVLVTDSSENQTVKMLYNEWLDEPGSEKAKKFLQTKYRPSVKSSISKFDF